MLNIATHHFASLFGVRIREFGTVIIKITSFPVFNLTATFSDCMHTEGDAA
jgi:hypothetical protein